MTRRVAIAVAVTACLVLLGGRAVWARPSAEITACIERASGYLKVGGPCAGGQTLVWNQQGPPGPKGDPGPAGPPGPRGPGDEPPSEVARLFEKHPFAALTAPPKATPKGLKVLQPAKGSGQAYSSFHDQLVDLELITSFSSDGQPVSTGNPVVSHLDVPAGAYVVVAKSVVFGSGVAARCTLVAGADYDESLASGGMTIALNVVHVFKKPGRIELRCVAVNAKKVAHIKITAIRVGLLKNTWVAPG